MNIYLLGLVLGGAGLGLMAVGGLGQHGHAGSHAHGAHHGGVHHGGVHHGGVHHGAAHHGAAQHGAAGQAAASHAGGVGASLLALASPRTLFSVLLGFGAAGLLAGRLITGPLLVLVALIGGVALERLVVAPLSRFLFGFASAPAQTLDTSFFDVATAASRFDANGEGLIALEIDGQVVQLLGRLAPAERVAGIQVRAGDHLRVEDVDATRNRCTVSVLTR